MQLRIQRPENVRLFNAQVVVLAAAIMLATMAACSGGGGSGSSSTSSGQSQPWFEGAANWGQPMPDLNNFYSFAEFNGAVFAGGRVVGGVAPPPNARLLESTDNGTTWTQVAVPFLATDAEVRRLWAGSDGYLYLVTASDGTTGSAPSIFRSADGSAWTFVQSLDPTDQYGRWFIEFNGDLYLGTVTVPGTGARLYRSADGLTWNVAVQFPLAISSCESLMVANGNLYASTDQAGTGGAGFIFQSSDGTNFTKINTNQLLGPTRVPSHSLVAFNGAYYVGQQDPSSTGAGRIWQSTDLQSWNLVFTAPGGTQEPEVYVLYPAHGELWAGTRTLAGTGGRVYESPDGITWTQVGSDGFGDVNYHGPFDFIFLDSANELLTSQRPLSISTDYPSRAQWLIF